MSSLKLDDLHKLLNDWRGQFENGGGVNEVRQMPNMSCCGPHSKPSRSGIAAFAHVLNYLLGSQRLIELVGVRPWLNFQHCICASGQLDAHSTRIDAPGKTIKKSDLYPNNVSHISQNIGRQLPTASKLILLLACHRNSQEIAIARSRHSP